MAWGTLNSVDLEAPSGMTVNEEIVGGDTETLGGKVRRTIRALRKVWTLNYSLMSASKYDELYALFAAGSAVAFTVTDTTYISIQSVNVFINLSPRQFVAGNPTYLANVTLTLIQEGS